MKKGANRADKERVYLLHRRSYSETSIIGYFFTRSYGVAHVLALGAKRKKGSYALLQPANEILLSWSGKSDLKTMRLAELSHRHNIYSGKSLTILIYLNEILLKLLKQLDPHPHLYDAYHDFLLRESQLSSPGNLRKFEHQIFTALGYGISWDKDYKSGEPIISNNSYVYDPYHGFTVILADKSANSFSGYDLLRMKAGEYDEVDDAAKQLSRLILHHLLESRPLASRNLIIKDRL